MKVMNRIRTGVAAAILSVCCFAYSGETEKPEGDLGYYENLSSLYFIYTSAYFDAVDDENEKKGAYRDYVFASFVYWLNTRFGDLQTSQKVDKGIQVIWESRFKNYEDGKAFLKDPLGWADPEKQKTHKISGFGDMTKTEYEEYLIRFHKFLNEDVK